MSAETANGDAAAAQASSDRDARHVMATAVQPRWAKPSSPPEPEAYDKYRRGGVVDEEYRK